MATNTNVTTVPSPYTRRAPLPRHEPPTRSTKNASSNYTTIPPANASAYAMHVEPTCMDLCTIAIAVTLIYILVARTSRKSSTMGSAIFTFVASYLARVTAAVERGSVGLIGRSAGRIIFIFRV